MGYENKVYLWKKLIQNLLLEIKDKKMKNFIKDIDTFYNEELLRNKIPKDNKKFTVFLSLNFKYGKNNNKNFILRKNDFTKYLFVKNDVIVYFSDADILNMLLQIDDRNIMDDLLLGLKNLFNGKGEEYIIFVNDVEYKGLGIPYLDVHKFLVIHKI